MKTFSVHSLVPAPGGTRGKVRRTHTWLSVKAEVLDRIRSGRWGAGQMIPTEHALAAELGCARATINRALRELADSGILERRRKVGTRVAAQPDPGALASLPMLTSQIEKTGMTAEYRLLAQDTVPAPADVAKRLHLPEATPLLYLVSLFTADGAPYCVEHRWINPALIGDPQPDFTRTSANEWVLTHPARSHGNMIIHPDSARTDCCNLQVTKGQPLLVIEADNWAGAQPISLTRQYFPPTHQLHLTT